MAVRYVLGATMLLAATTASSQPVEPPGTVTASVNPGRVCLDKRQPSYLMASVLSPRGEAVEMRMLAAQALDLLGTARTVAAGADAVLFNPLVLNSVKQGSQNRYRVDF